jgi:hypothetical protein
MCVAFRIPGVFGCSVRAGVVFAFLIRSVIAAAARIAMAMARYISRESGTGSIPAMMDPLLGYGSSAFHQVLKMELFDHGLTVIPDLIRDVLHVHGVQCINIHIKTGSPRVRGRMSLIRDVVCRCCFRSRCLPGQE